MEQKSENKVVSTKASERGVVLSQKEAEEYRAYVRNKKVNAIAAAIASSEGSLLGGEDVQRVCERAVRLKQTSIKLPLTKLALTAAYLTGSRVGIDCVVGGAGETLSKVKAYETRLAVRKKAREITLPITPSLIDGCRYEEIRKEMKKVRRAAGKAKLKVRVETLQPSSVVSRIARIACEVGVHYFSVPYAQGCEKFRLDLTGGCKLEVTGVETTAQFKQMVQAGVARIVTEHAAEIYAEWIKEAEAESRALFSQTVRVEQTPPMQKGCAKACPESRETQNEEKADKEVKAEKQATEKNPSTVTPAIPSPPSKHSETRQPPATSLTVNRLPVESNLNTSETDYYCRLEGTRLKFY